MDEPCSALDPIATAKIEELIDELRQNFTIVIVTHSMQQAARVSQKTAFFHLGKIDDVVLWSRALLPVEIKEIFESAEDGKSAGALLDAGSPE